ncbi:MAG TPA: hypothetical protein VJ739_05455 [Gemmataceae bacterium]|nr:hypothetical protein [Gemmataceae bacterium]
MPSTLTATNTLDSGHGSLRYEIAQAEKSNGKDMVVFNIPKSDPGYNASTGAWTIKLTSGELDITGGLNIQGPGAGLLTVSGGYSSRVFEVEPNVTVALSGLTISNGNGAFSSGYPHPEDFDGGGILNLGTLRINGCTVSNNQTGFDTWTVRPGGGICNFGTLALSGCTVSGNRSSGGTGAPGGGIYNGGSLTLSSCMVSGNSAGGGGGIYNGGTLTLSGCMVSGNSAGSNYLGGGICNAGALTVSSSTFHDNSAYEGGGISNVGAGTLTVSTSTFYGNYPDNVYGAYTDGGGNSLS